MVSNVPSILRASARLILVIFASGLLLFTAPPAATAQQPFTEEALSRGVIYFTLNSSSAGRGVAFVDLDLDHDPDVVCLGGYGGAVGIFENDGTGYFYDRSAGSGIPSLPAASGVVAADYDSDGDLDLYVTAWLAENRLLRNEGGFTFSDVTEEAGVGDAGAGAGACWGDVDTDGWLDLYVANVTTFINTTPNRFYRNRGDGTFEELGGELGIDDPNETWQAVFFDYDRDGDPDLYVSNDKGYDCSHHNYLFENVGGEFVDVTDSSGTAACIASMGVAVGDYDGNLLPDLYCSNIPQGNPLFLNQSRGIFLEEAATWDVLSYCYGWATDFFDFDNDGVLDLYVCNQGATNRLYCHVGTPPAIDMASTVGVDTLGNSYCMAVADVDDDGDLDFLVQNDNEILRLYVNHEGESRKWVKFRVAGTDQNRFAVGASLAIDAELRSQLREVAAGANFKSQNHLDLHVGLGGSKMVDSVTALWPGGVSRKVHYLAAGRTWTIYPPNRLGDYDGNGAWNRADVAGYFLCYTGAKIGKLEPGCEMMDLDGDGDVDEADYALLLERLDRGGSPTPLGLDRPSRPSGGPGAGYPRR